MTYSFKALIEPPKRVGQSVGQSWDNATKSCPTQQNVVGQNFEPHPAWSAALATLQGSVCPAWMAPERWQAILDTAGSFVAQWSRAAAALGWEPRAFLGLDGPAKFPTYSPSGLPEAFIGLIVRAVTARGITVQFPDGTKRTIERNGRQWTWGE